MTTPTTHHHRRTPERAHRWRRTTARVLTGLAVLATPLLLATQPAQAATPRCNYAMGVRLGTDIYAVVPAYDINGNRTWRCLMGYGDGFTSPNRGVTTLQETLNYCYQTVIGDRWPLSTDGRFGPNTRLALIRVQTFAHVDHDGVYGPQTAAAITHKTTAITPYGIFYTCDKIPAGQ